VKICLFEKRTNRKIVFTSQTRLLHTKHENVTRGIACTMFPDLEPCVRGPTRKDLYQVLPEESSSLYGGKVAGLIWIRFAAELRFGFAKSSRPPLKMWKCKVKSTIIFRFKGVCHTNFLNPWTTFRSGPWKSRCLNQYKIFQCLLTGTLN